MSIELRLPNGCFTGLNSILGNIMLLDMTHILKANSYVRSPPYHTTAASSHPVAISSSVYQGRGLPLVLSCLEVKVGDGRCIVASPRQLSRLMPGSSSSWSKISPSIVSSNTIKHSKWIINLLYI